MITQKQAVDILYVELGGKYSQRVYSTCVREFTQTYPSPNTKFKLDPQYQSVAIDYVKDSTKDINP